MSSSARRGGRLCGRRPRSRRGADPAGGRPRRRGRRADDRGRPAPAPRTLSLAQRVVLEALNAIRAAVALLPDDGPGTERAQVLGAEGHLLMLLGRGDEATARCEAALEVARAAGARRRRARSSQPCAPPRASPGRLTRGSSTAREALRIAEERGDAEEAGAGLRQPRRDPRPCRAPRRGREARRRRRGRGDRAGHQPDRRPAGQRRGGAPAPAGALGRRRPCGGASPRRGRGRGACRRGAGRARAPRRPARPLRRRRRHRRGGAPRAGERARLDVDRARDHGGRRAGPLAWGFTRRATRSRPCSRASIRRTKTPST